MCRAFKASRQRPRWTKFVPLGNEIHDGAPVRALAERDTTVHAPCPPCALKFLFRNRFVHFLPVEHPQLTARRLGPSRGYLRKPFTSPIFYSSFVKRISSVKKCHLSVQCESVHQIANSTDHQMFLLRVTLTYYPLAVAAFRSASTRL